MKALITHDEFLDQAGALQRLRAIIDKAIEDKWKTTDTMKVIKREMSLLDAEYDVLDKKEQDAMVRAALGVDESAVIPAETYLMTLFKVVCFDRRGS